MVDVLTTNKKLVDRARRIVMRVTGADYEKVDAVLNETRNNVKPAIVMITNSCGLERTQEILKENDGFIRKTIKP
jgi:N-acetylmuramic acid 6-phosphate etherase